LSRRKHDDDDIEMVEAVMGDGSDARPLAPQAIGDDRRFDESLRPQTFDEFIGQRAVADKLKVYVTAAKQRGDVLDHVLLSGPPGLGKTTLAHVIAHEMGTVARVTSGPTLERKSDLAGILTSLGRGDVLFIDEIHRLSPVIEESLYPAMEDFRIEIVTGAGPGASALSVPLEPFTLVGATTRTGRLTSPLRDRFGIVERFEYYNAEDLAAIVLRSGRILGIDVDDRGALEIGGRARGTPRIANRLLRRVRDFAQVRGEDRVTADAARYGLDRLEVDAIGLDSNDRRYLGLIIERYGGGPVGVEALAAAMSEDRDTLEYVIEPYLIQEGFVQRTPRGRHASRRAYEHLNFPWPPPGGGPQGSLF
jgi:holliday junction DNA helicase RuvB